MFGFNPHPASLPGDAMQLIADKQQWIVSIRTRHRCRVMPCVARDLWPSPAFQSAPGIAAG